MTQLICEVKLTVITVIVITRQSSAKTKPASESAPVHHKQLKLSERSASINTHILF